MWTRNRGREQLKRGAIGAIGFGLLLILGCPPAQELPDVAERAETETPSVTTPPSTDTGATPTPSSKEQPTSGGATTDTEVRVPENLKPPIPNPLPHGTPRALADADSDGVPDHLDNCLDTANPGQEDSDRDGLGDACDLCPLIADDTQFDQDSDGVGNECDNCPLQWNPDQEDWDEDGIGNDCDPMPYPLPGRGPTPGGGGSTIDDRDGDGIVNNQDNCPYRANPDQADADGDGIGDVCEVEIEVDAFDTGGATGGGFVGEVDHFVFDVMIEMDSEDNWTVAGIRIDPQNEASMRLPPTPAGPTVVTFPVSSIGTNPFVTFPGQPYAVADPARFEASVEIAGGYTPTLACNPRGKTGMPLPLFAEDALSVVWFDIEDSQDGRKAIFRVVLDVSAMEDIDVSAGFGSVYFTTAGPTDPSDVQVACFDIGVGHIWGQDIIVFETGVFYVAGQ